MSGHQRQNIPLHAKKPKLSLNMQFGKIAKMTPISISIYVGRYFDKNANFNPNFMSLPLIYA